MWDFPCTASSTTTAGSAAPSSSSTWSAVSRGSAWGWAVCASPRNWLSGSHREPQRPMAESSLVAIRTPISSRTQRPLWKVRGSRTGEIRHTYRSCSLAATVPQTMAVGSAKHPQGSLIYIRRTSDRGQVSMLGRQFLVDRNWVHRLVRSDVDLKAGNIHFYALRRREPTEQPLLKTTPYKLPKRPFNEWPICSATCHFENDLCSTCTDIWPIAAKLASWEQGAIRRTLGERGATESNFRRKIGDNAPY